MPPLITTFPKRIEFEKVKGSLDALSLPYEIVSPDPGFRYIRAPAVVMESKVRMELAAKSPEDFTSSGWVDYRPAEIATPQEEPTEFEDNIFGEAAIMVLAPCVADPAKIRIIAHISGNLEEVFPYLNAEMHEGCYNRNGPTFAFMDAYRMITLYPRRIAVAKADEIVDAWRSLEYIRCRTNETWSRRDRITPSYELREKPPAVEIFKRLPGINCGQCGEKTCLAFAVTLWMHQTTVSRCTPVFSGEYAYMKDALIEICAGLGVLDEDREFEPKGISSAGTGRHQ